MDEMAWMVGGLALVMAWLAWREHAGANRRDAKLLAGFAVLTGIAGAVSAVL